MRKWHRNQFISVPHFGTSQKRGRHRCWFQETYRNLKVSTSRNLARPLYGLMRVASVLGALCRSGRHQIYPVYPANKLPDMLTDREDSQNLPMGLETDSGVLPPSALRGLFALKGEGKFKFRRLHLIVGSASEIMDPGTLSIAFLPQLSLTSLHRHNKATPFCLAQYGSINFANGYAMDGQVSLLYFCCPTKQGRNRQFSSCARSQALQRFTKYTFFGVHSA